jgi:hypothetical protein
MFYKVNKDTLLDIIMRRYNRKSRTKDIDYFIEQQLKQQDDDEMEDYKENQILESPNEKVDEEFEQHSIKENKIIILFYCYSKKVFGVIFKIGEWVIKISGVYLVWIALHFFASQFYIELCVPKTIYGFLVSPFLIATPHCQALRWIVYNGANAINNMWIVMGTWFCSQIMFYTGTNHSITPAT